MLRDLQRTIGNARVTRLIVQRATETRGKRESVVPGTLVPNLFVQLAPESPDPVLLITTIEGAAVPERRAAYANTPLRDLLISRMTGDDRKRVLSALLAGKPYLPGAMSILYQSLTTLERHDIDVAIQARFLSETGIGDPLDWTNADDKPLARRWLELRDLVVDTLLVRPDRVKAYEDYLREAVALLSSVDYGRASGWAVGEDAEDKYDLEFWEEIPDEEVMKSEGKGLGMLRLKPGVRPSQAIDELFAKLDHWAFDCAEFVQVAHLYAMRHTMGDQAFERILAEDAGKAQVLLRSHGSTGLKSRVLYQRDKPGDKMREFYSGTDVETSVDQLLADAPIGSRIVWRNLAANPADDIYNENTIKLGPDEFAAHGLDPDNKKTVFTRARVELELARRTWTLAGDPDQKEIDANVFIRAIQHYIVP